MTYNPSQFAEKYLLALENALQEKPSGGLCGFELEWNLLDAEMKPLLTVGAGPSQQSFVDYLRAQCIAPWVREFSQLEVFHWMIEWATRPYYQPRQAVYEARLMEGLLINALDRAGRNFKEPLSYWHGNLLFPAEIGHASIPGSWQIAKRRYLERCVDLYGDSLATAGTHTNLSLPDPLFAWDFMHLSSSERGDLHLDAYKSSFYITATRLMRAFAALFIAASASTPLQAGRGANGEPVVHLTETDSVRNLTFPNPPAIDIPGLYRSYDDYLRISYDLVRRGVRFGNNNWTPVRARSFAEPVERLILVTSEQLHDLYSRGLYAIGDDLSVDEIAHQIEIQNLMARINLPMARVEVRTDDGGHPLDVDIANLTLKHLLMLRFYADPEFARAFRYDAEDIARARRNEAHAAEAGLRAEIENPFTGKPVNMREFLRWTLGELRPLAEALDQWADLTPLVEMAAGGPNTAEQMRMRLAAELDGVEAPAELLKRLAGERLRQAAADVETIAETLVARPEPSGRLEEFIQRARDEAHSDPQLPVRFRPSPRAVIEGSFSDKTSEILALAQALIRIPSVTAAPVERLDEVRRAATFIFDYVRLSGLGVRFYSQEKYPALLIGFPGQMTAPVMLSGHYDVVAPEPNDRQFEPRVDGDYLWGRGAADMKTVVATYLVWFRDAFLHGPPYPPVSLLLVGNEENGEVEPSGTPHVLRLLEEDECDANGRPYRPQLFIAGERTGEHGDELWGEICTQNRGVMRFEVIARGERQHSSAAGGRPASDLTERLLIARSGVIGILGKRLTLNAAVGGPGGWHSQARFPFVQVGTPGVYNVTADQGVLGVEVRPIPQDDISGLRDELQAYCNASDLELHVNVMEPGIACNPANPYLSQLVAAVRQASGMEPVIGRKLPGTSARFAPGGQGIVWGQSGLGPHARDERHYIPSILPYYQALIAFGNTLKVSEDL